MINKLIISAPFGNHYNVPGVTSTIGTYTLEHRGGWWYRWWRVIRTVRYIKRMNGWINKLGLPCPSLNVITEEQCKGKILSIHGFSKHEWNCLVVKACARKPLAIELNLSCPNVSYHATLAEINEAVPVAHNAQIDVIAKLPPIRWMDFVIPLYDCGVRFFHLCNTMPTPTGGLSGKTLKQYSLWAVEEVRRKFGNSVKIIGGGGITCSADVYDYIDAGADHVAIASVLLNVLRNKKRLIQDLLATVNSYQRI